MVASSVPQQYTVADFIQWHQAKTLELNPNFQRKAVWTSAANSYFINTILLGFPSPKIFLRNILDTKKMQSIREVVDGQQRLRAILDFVNDKFILTKHAGIYKGLRYSQLETELQEKFLSYVLSVDQLINASDSDILDMFARLNSYNVKLNAAELRHAEYQGDFKWNVRQLTLNWNKLWEQFKILSVTQRLRMQDDSLMAEMFGILLQGITGGQQPNITALYIKYDTNFTEAESTISKVNGTLSFIYANIELALSGSVANSPHFLMLFAAVAHALYNIPQGEIQQGFPEQDHAALSDITIVIENITKLSDIISQDSIPRETDELNEFWTASKSSTQTMRSRRVRFPIYYKALLPKLM